MKPGKTRLEPSRNFRAAVDLAPENAQPKVNLADFMLRQNKPDAARQILGEITAKYPDYLPALYRQASMICRADNAEACLKALEPVFRKNPTDPEGLLMRGRVYLAKGQNTEAMQDFQEILKQQPKALEALYLLAGANLQAGDTVQAKANLQAALSAEPNFTEANLRLAEIYLREGNYQAVLDIVGKFPEKDAKTPKVYYLLATAYTGKKEWLKAVEAGRNLMETDPADARGPYMRGFSLRELGKKDEARKYFEEAGRLSPGRHEPVAELVTMDLADNKPDAAVGRLKEELDRSPDSAGLHFLLGRVYLTRTRPTRPRPSFSRVPNSTRSWSTAYVALTQIYAASRNFDQALAKLDAALKANPDNLTLLMLSGMIQQQNGNTRKAQEAYEKILAKDPGFAPAANNLACIYSENPGRPGQSPEAGTESQGRTARKTPISPTPSAGFSTRRETTTGRFPT